MTYLSSIQIVERYRSFFDRHQHLELPGSPLVVPGNSTSFVIAGMQSLLPYLRGEVKPPSPRLQAIQRCLRTDDVDDVGLTIRKNTAFFMLGNWSIGNYDKRTAIQMALDLLLNHYGLCIEQLRVTVFEGDASQGLPLDGEAMNEWQRLGISSQQIFPLGEDNFWTMGEGPGPCGLSSEIFVDRGEELGCGKPDCRPGCDCARYLEVWNLVFMEYERHSDGSLTPLPQRNIDTGMGLERIGCILQEADSVYSVDLFQPALERLRELAPEDDGSPLAVRARRMIVDHMRAVLLAGLAGVGPGRDGKSSVVRRLIRRAARQGRLLGIKRPFLGTLLEPLAQAHGGLLTSEEQRGVPDLEPVVTGDEKMFGRVLSVGLRELEHVEPDERGLVPGSYLFRLHAEKGFPSDLAAEILAERGLSVDWSGYEQAVEEHRIVSRT
jgi:alanyl-tRNA synthetase